MDPVDEELLVEVIKMQGEIKHTDVIAIWHCWVRVRILACQELCKAQGQKHMQDEAQEWGEWICGKMRWYIQE